MSEMRRHSVSSPEDLVTSLTRDLKPVRPVRLGREIVVAMLLEVVVVVLSAWLLGARVAGTSRLGDPMFVALLAALATGAGASAAAMAALAIPGRAVSATSRLLLLALPLVLAATVVVLSPWGATWKGFVAVFVEGFGCTRNTLLVAAPAWLAGLLYLRRLGPLDPLRVGLFAGFSALLTAALAVQMACRNCDAWHLAVSHYAPILVAAWVAAMLSPLVLGRGPSGPRPR